MREIKFRAYDKIDKRLIIDKQDFIPLIVTNKGVFKLDPCCEYNRWIEIEEDRFILMQYTGLKDKNSVEIYEGDIVKADCRSGHNKDNGKYVIEYDRTNCCFYGNPGPVIQLFGLMLDIIRCEPISDLRQNIEVIGNIYENKELLNTKGEIK